MKKILYILLLQIAVFIAFSTESYSAELLNTSAFTKEGVEVQILYRIYGNEVLLEEMPDDEVTGHLDIPGTIEGLPVTMLWCYAFAYCNLNSFTIPDNVTKIGQGAFLGCDSLTEVIIPEQITDVYGFAFSDCKSLTDVTVLSGSTTIHDSAFSNCISLVNVSLSDGVRRIAPSTFSGCSSLVSITIPDSMIEIGDSAFNGCTSLESVVIPDNVTFIGNSVFKNCVSLAEVTMGDSLREILDHCFWYCDSLTSITIPDSVTRLIDRTFMCCDSLTEVMIGDGVDTIEMGVFTYCSKLRSVTFTGNAPSQVEGPPFLGVANDFCVYFYAGSTGFTTPTWNGYPSQMVNRPGDIDLDTNIDGTDLDLLRNCIGSSLGDSRYIEAADLEKDDVIDKKDIFKWLELAEDDLL